MRLPFARRPPLTVVIITGSCCFPGLVPLEKETNRAVAKALGETGLDAEIRVISAAAAYLGQVPRSVIAELMAANSHGGGPPLPAVLVNGKPVSFGVPSVEGLKTAFLQAVNPEPKEAHSHD
ncbi:MAG: hypothetical protein M1337_05040 [Actinobacteria bacterium]|nr:hypothetical protein [Actinomycetota bacterium]